MMCIIQIGEVVNKISDEKIKEKMPTAKITGLRNRIVHGYEEVDKTIITEVLKSHIPQLEITIMHLIGE